jgi:anaerobic dimethyl sulfoxide reductase subunit B (iron-sulfur subunit)
MTQLGFFFDNNRCTGCKACQLACKDYKDLSIETNFRRVFDYEGGAFTDNGDGTWATNSFAYHVSVACNHCAMPACLAACAVGAISKDVDNGLVLIDSAICIGCGNCVTACPYSVPKMNTETTIAVKCDACVDRQADNMPPVCVDACQMRALLFGDLDELRSTYGNTSAIAPLPDPTMTEPSLVIKKGSYAKETGDNSGFIGNEAELV